jgi:hypothetical protein
MMKPGRVIVTWSALLLLSCGGPAAKEATPVGTPSARPVMGLPTGGFRVTALDPPAGGGARYLAEAADTCTFEFTIGNAKSAGKGQFDFAFAPAVLERRAQTDCRDFLRRLAPELGYDGALPTPRPVKRLEINLTILGTHQSRSSDHPQIAGSFSSDPPGEWIATKLFLADGEGEVFLNFNPKEGVGEFAYKDSDYAVTVVTELAKILLPQASS